MGDRPGEPSLELVGLTKSFGSQAVLHGLDLTAEPGEFISLVGPSGCGKTTTLNIVAGFEQPDEGDVRLTGRSILDIPSHRRGLGMVFQSHALFPHMTVAGNVGFGLLMRGVRKDEIGRRVAAALDLVRLAGLGHRFPRELSGGQQQRVGIARALTVDPRVILMDEPLSSLDAKLRREMQVELRRIQKTVGITAIYVTHDQEEALSLSDRIVLLNRGRVEQVGTPEDLYQRPANEFVAGFIGEASFLDGTMGAARDGGSEIALAGGGTIVAKPPAGIAAGQPVRVAVRPDRLRLAEPAPGTLDGTILARTFMGPVRRYLVAAEGGQELLAEMPAEAGAPAEVGTRVACRAGLADWFVFPGPGRPA